MERLPRPSLIAAIAVAAISWMPASNVADPGLSAETRSNLEAAMRGEAYEYLLYRAYAMKAHLSGNPDLAKVFEDVADQEGNDHFMREAVALGAIGDNASNLEFAAKSEMGEQIGVYTKYSEQAEKAGDKSVAALFQEIAGEEARHHDYFVKALDKYRHESP